MLFELLAILCGTMGVMCVGPVRHKVFTWIKPRVGPRMRAVWLRLVVLFITHLPEAYSTSWQTMLLRSLILLHGFTILSAIESRTRMGCSIYHCVCEGIHFAIKPANDEVDLKGNRSGESVICEKLSRYNTGPNVLSIHGVLTKEMFMLSREDPAVVGRARAKIATGMFEANLKYIIMDIVEGGDLFHSLLNGELSSLTNVYMCCNQVSMGVQSLHRLGLFHRDLKPENILKQIHNGQVTNCFVCDFDTLLFATNLLHGTVYNDGTDTYMSPEQLAHGREIPVTMDFMATDVWALGVIFFVLITQHHSIILPRNDEGARCLELIRGGNALDLIRELNCEGRFWGTTLSTVMAMLDPNPTTRATIDGVVTGFSLAPPVPPVPEAKGDMDGEG